MVVIHGRDAARAEQAAQEIVSQGGRACIAIGNLATDEGAQRVAEQAVAAVGAIDVLINNAGKYENRGWTDATADDWADLYNANVLSAVRMIRLLAPQMKARRWGRIIQLASGEATQPFAFMPDYAATKAALVNLTVSLAKDLASSGITVNTISPGIVVTSGVERFYRETGRARGWGATWSEIEQAVLREILYNPVGRLGSVDDVAHLVAFLASPLAGYINGANYRVDGGSTVTVN